MYGFLLTLVLPLVLTAGASAQAPALTREPIDPSAARFGEATAVVPDVDGDGVPDLAVGAPNEEAFGQSGQGRVYVFSGATGTLRYRIEPPNPDLNHHFGSALAGVPDTDGAGPLRGSARYVGGCLVCPPHRHLLAPRVLGPSLRAPAALPWGRAPLPAAA